MDDLWVIVDGILATDPAHFNSAHRDRNMSAADCCDLPWQQFDATYSH